MPLNDSTGMEETGRDPVAQRERPQSETAEEEIVTPIEAEIEEEAEREFENPPAHKVAIVSVNGEDVGEVPIAAHDRAA